MTLVPARRDAVCRAAAALLLAALLLVALGRAVLAQSGGAVTLDEYQAKLEQVRSDVANAAAGETQQAVRRAATELAGIERVQVGGSEGEVLTLEPLFAAEDTPQRALDRIDAVLVQLSTASADDTAARLAALDRVLAGDALHPERGLLGWLQRLFEGRNASGAEGAANNGARALNILLGVAGGLVAVFLIGRIIQAALGAFMSEASVAARDSDGSAPLTVAAARRRASYLAQAGSYREAVRLLYLATLLSLEDRGLLRIDRSLTNREVLASVGRRDAVHARLRPVVDVFETVWYGEREPDRETFERYALAVESAAEAIAAEPLAAVNAPEAG